MAGMCCGVNLAETEATTPVEPSSEAARRRRMEIHQFRLAPPLENGTKRHKVEKVVDQSKRRKLETSVTISLTSPLSVTEKVVEKEFEAKPLDLLESDVSSVKIERPEVVSGNNNPPKFGTTSVCGRRRDMEDAVAVHPSFCKEENENSNSLHFYGVYDGHGCSHVAMKCKDRMHEIVKNEVEKGETQWKEVMTQSFSQMDNEVVHYSSGALGGSRSNCRCELQTPQCDAVGSTAVVAVVTPEKIIVSNCGDSRAVLCRNGVAIPLSIDHKPDRPDELNRIQEAGGRVIYWDGPRVLGVLAMSRAIGDNYLKPYVISEPEVTITERTEEDECLILASDGLWDVVSNETACGVARMCLQSRKPPSPHGSPENDVTVTGAGESSDQLCSDASILLTKLALARHSTDNVSVVVVDLRKDL
ncbi:protein phosphatase 2C 37-like [Nicotiana tabacum]|uniref:protein-serine/threonine phosphatase n=1 Tax=Nicotiana tabacum TaxID=4097 RepID=Q8RVG0_TOBAC|nr:protein phosphatase 2C 37-like [Nicotiana tabacum]XP_009604512.1 protein phosphatase 2C 37-like [Nicotiana tomentosiformis]CAC10358.1 protein phosphatase 2C [Nicotiana tabacum]CAC84141.2 protein phosphatase 2C [Nicotiana tabacum]